jgi:DNA invertase Pin-like site-specific DNA recombinase
MVQWFMHIGYARVSTDDQHTENQIEQLTKAGCERIYEEHASGRRWDRPELQDCLKHIRKGDTLVVWKLDRLTRSLSDLLRILAKVNEAGAGFRSLTESIDTTQPAGRLLMNMLGRTRRNEFVELMRDARMIFLRNGANRWHLYEDLKQPNKFRMEIVVPSWTPG